MMLNLSNLAWFEDSIALPQHLQISRMRALETQHPMLRATNTGATAIVDATGAVVAQLPYNTGGRARWHRAGAGGLDTVPAVRERAGARAVCADVLLLVGRDHAHGRGVALSRIHDFDGRSMRPRRDGLNSPMITFQEAILRLQDYWSRQGCALLQPIDLEVGAGTSHTATFLRAIGPEPWRAAYVQPSRRPKDARYGENPNRLHQHHQYQVVLKPSPPDILDVYLGSLTRSASIRRRTTSASSRTTGRTRRSAAGDWAGKCG